MGKKQKLCRSLLEFTYSLLQLVIFTKSGEPLTVMSPCHLEI